MRTTSLGFAGSLPWLVLGAALSVACGDDGGSDPAPGVDAGESDAQVTETETDGTETDGTATDGTETDGTETSDTSTLDGDAGDSDTDSGTTDTDVTTDDAGTDVVDSGTDTTSDSETDSGTDLTEAGSDVIEAGTEPEPDAGDSGLTETDVDSGTDVVTDPEEAGTDAGVDAGEPEPTFAAITELDQALVTGVNDLRGLVFTQDGQSLLGSGQIGVALTDDRQVAVVKLGLDGTPDESFSEDGIWSVNLAVRGEGETPANDGDESSYSLVELANGDIIVAANTRDASGAGRDIVLIKLDETGEPVTEFGEEGFLRVDLGWTPEDEAEWPETVTGAPADTTWDIQLDTSSGVEKLVLFAAGTAQLGQQTGPETARVQRTDTDRWVARLLATDGSHDPEFNGGVPYFVNTGGTFNDNSRRGVVFEDGGILSAGYTNLGEGVGNHVVVLKLLPNGTPDPAFSFGIGLPGIVRTNPFIDDGGAAECYAVGVQSNGRYVTTGYGRATAANVPSELGWLTSTAEDLVSVGFFGDGIDETYGSFGTLAFQSEESGQASTEDRGRDLVVLGDDRVVHVGKFGISPAIFVTLPDGSPDLNFGVDGRLDFAPLTDPTSHFFRVTQSPDKTLLAATTNAHVDGVLLAVLQIAE